MVKRILITSLCVLTVFAITLSCKHKAYLGPSGGGDSFEKGCYPDAIANIIVKRCATAGCHNAASYTGANDLLLDTWEHLFNGGANGAAVVPYSPDYSPLLTFINQDTSNGDAFLADPHSRMPQDGTILSAADYQTIKDWIKNGAPNCSGKIAFSDDATTRQKIYLTQQGCDLVAVIDAQSKLVMRYIKAGVLDGVTESPHCVRIAADGNKGFVCFTGGTSLQRINTTTDNIDASVPIPSVNAAPSWNILYITPDGSNVLVCDYNASGGAVLMDAVTMSGTAKKYFSPMIYPHGVTSSGNFDTLYVSSQYGNAVYKFPSILSNTDLAQKISLNSNPAVPSPTPTGGPNPHEVVMVPDGSKYIVTCQGTNEVKVLDAHTNAILKTFTAADGVGVFPQEVALSAKNGFAYISCQDKDNVVDTFKGSVFVFNYKTLSAVGVISAKTGKLSQPHGITVDDRNDVLYVASINANGPAPHHVTKCGGRNGYYRIFSSIPPFTQINGRTYEVSVAPYSMDVRFKN